MLSVSQADGRLGRGYVASCGSVGLVKDRASAHGASSSGGGGALEGTRTLYPYMPRAAAGNPQPAASLCTMYYRQVAKRELALECDYSYELRCQARFRDLLAADPQLAPHFHVPAVVPELSSQRILATEWVHGVPIDKVRAGCVGLGARAGAFGARGAH